MSNLAVALAITLNDQLSGAPARKVSDAIRGIGKTASEVGKGLSTAFKTGFSVDNIDLALKQNEQKMQAARGRLTAALGMAATIAVPVRFAANFQDELIDFVKVAEIPIEQMGAIEQRLMQATRQTGKSKSELLSSVAAYVGKGMDFDTAFDALVSTGRAATATKSDIGDMSNSGFAVMDNMNVSARDLATAFNVMAISGKEGSFELQAMSRKFPEVTAGARALKMEGVAGVASLAAALQISMKSAGGEDQAATNFTNFLGKITAPDTVKKFADMGVNIEKEMKKASASGIDVLDHMLGVIAKKTGGDAFKMGELFQDKQVLDFLKAIIPNLEEYRRIRDKAMSGKDVIDKDFSIEAMKANFAFNGLKNAIDGMLGSSGALLPIITGITNDLTGLVYAVTDWTIANPELTATIVKTTAGLLAFGVASRVGAYAFYGIRGAAIRTIATFFKFDEAGKNVAITAKALRGVAFVGQGAFMLLSGAASGLAGVIGATLGGLGTVIAGVTAPVWGIAAAVAAVVIGTGAMVYKYWEPIKNFVSGFASVVGTELSGMLAGIAGFGAEVAAEVGAWGTQKLIDISGWLGIDEATVKTALDKASKLIIDSFNNTINFFAGLPDKIGGYLSSIFTQKDYSAEAEAEFRSAGERAGEAMVAAIKGAVNSMVDWFSGLGTRIFDAVGSIDISGIISWPKLPSWLGGGDGESGGPEISVPPGQQNDALQDIISNAQGGRSPLVEPAYQPASAAATPTAPVINNVNAPNINVSATANVKNETSIQQIARQVGALTEKKTRMALSDAGAE